MVIKNSWQDITIREYQELLRIKDSTTMDDFEKDLEIVLLLSDVSRQELTDLPVTALKQIFQEIKFLDTIPEAAVKPFYKIGGRTYKLIREVAKITGGQFIDLMEMVKDKTQINNRLHDIMAVLMVPLKKRKWWQFFLPRRAEKYLETPHEHTAVRLLDMCIVDALAINNFFFALSTSIAQTSLHYSLNKNSETLTKLLNKLKTKRNPTATERKAMQDLQALLDNINGFTT